MRFSRARRSELRAMNRRRRPGRLHSSKTAPILFVKACGLLRKALILTAILCQSAAAQADETVVIDNYARSENHGQMRFSIARVEFADTNLTQEEISTLLNPHTRIGVDLELLGRLRAAHIKLSGIRVSGPVGIEVESITAKGVTPTHCDEFAINNVKGIVVDQNRLLPFWLRGFHVGGVDLLAADETIFRWPTPVHIADASLEDASAAYPDDEQGVHRISLGAVSGTGLLSGARTEFWLRDLVLWPALHSGLQEWLLDVGYDHVSVVAHLSSAMDAATKTLTVADASLTAAGMGQIRLTGELSDLLLPLWYELRFREYFLLASELKRLEIASVDYGLVHKMIEKQMRDEHRTLESVRADWLAPLDRIPPLLKETPEFEQFKAKASAFLAEPGALTLTIEQRSEPTTLLMLYLGYMNDPKYLLDRFQFSTTFAASP